MKINEVENLVGITKKNIRFYEQEGLIEPKRNSSNGYREYDEADVETLKIIKMLRILDISLEEIRLVLREERELQDVLSVQVRRMEEKQKSLQEIKLLCSNMIAEHVEIGSDKMPEYTSHVNLLEKEGHSLVDVKNRDKRNKGIASIVAAMVILVLISLFIAGMVALGLSDAAMPIWVWFLILPSPILVFVGVIIALVSRIKEIKGGEEYEASKY